MTYPKNITVWDFETTGLDPFVHKPIEAAWVIVKDGCVTKARRYFLNYQVDIPEGAREIHGITREDIEQSEDAGLDPSTILQELATDILASEAHVTHNGTYFDLLFLLNNTKNPGNHLFEPMLRERHIDTAAVFKGRGIREPKKADETLEAYSRRVLKIRSTFKFNLKAAAEAHGIAVSNTHRAMDDVMLTHALYSKMCLKV